MPPIGDRRENQRFPQTWEETGMRRPSAEQLIDHWQLTTMPTENVQFLQTYVDPRTGPDSKPLCSAIIALLVDDPTVFSDMHRLPTDELWHFYLGDPIELLLFYSDGSDELVILGQDILAGQRRRPWSRRGRTWVPGFGQEATTASTETPWRQASSRATLKAPGRRS
jgi:predicted cupin superfamily sugar epimerase